MSDGSTARVLQALERYKLGSEAITAQVQRETEDLQFQIPEPEFQWSAEARAMRAGATVGNMALPAKPMLCIPKLDQPIQLILNQEKAAHLGVQVHPLSEDADDDTAEIIQGIYRRIEVDSRAGLARSWAYERAVKCGRGAYRILTEYADDGGHFTDQKITIKRLLHQEAAIFDPFAQEPDWSDGRWAFVTEWVPWDRYKQKYPKSQLASYDPEQFTDLFTETPQWVTGDGEGRAVLVAEYFYLEYASRTRVLLDDGSDAYDDAVPDGRSVLEGPEARSRHENVPQLKWLKMNAFEELESEDRDGKYIPLVPVIGRELIPFQNSGRRWAGIITQNKDGARMFNYAASQAVTVAALEPMAPFVLDPRQIEGYEPWWNQANSRQFPYLPAMFDQNKGWGAPQRTQIDAGRLGPSMMLIQQADAFLHSGTSAYEATLGDTSPQNKTKGGILALQQQHEQANSHFLDHLAEISITYEAKVVLDLIPYVYDRPGRVVRTLDLEDNSQSVMINAPFVKGQGGRPQPAPPQMPAMMGQMPAAAQQGPQGQSQGQPKVYHYDLNKGRYGVIVSVGKSYQNRAQQGKDELGQIFQAAPETFPLLADLYFKFADFPGHREASERMKKMLPPQLQDKDEGAIEQEAAQLKAENAQMKQALQEMGDALKTDKIKVDGQMAIAEGKNQATLIKTQMDNETKLAVAELGAKVDRMSLFLEERARLGVQDHEAAMGGADAAHEQQMAQQQHQQALQQAAAGVGGDAALAEQGQAHALEQGQQGHQQALEQGQQAAELAPEPKAGA